MRARHEVAIVDGSTNEALTFAELHANTYRFAHALREQFGVGSDDTVAIYAPNHKHYFSVFQGIGLTGGRSTPINPMYTEEEVSFQCRMTHAKAIVAHPMCMGVAQAVAAQLGIPVISFDNCAGTTSLASLLHPLDSEGGPGGGGDGGVGSALTESFAGIDPTSTMTIPFSSGTTGTPKGVMLTHDNLVANVLQSIPQEVGRLSRSHPDNWGERGALCVPVPFYHILGMITGMCAPLRVGGKMVFLPSFDLQQFLQLVQEHRVTKAYAVPPIVLALTKHPLVDDYDISSLRTIMCAGAPLKEELQMACAQRLNIFVKQAWGMTELSPIGTIVPDPKGPYDTWDVLRETKAIAGSSGELAPATEGKLVCPESGEDMCWDEEGELLIRGPQIMRGYLDNETATATTIRADGWMHTGDVATFDAHGRMFITDRCKELIKYKGFQVAPAELEDLIASMDRVGDVIVIPVEDEGAGELPRAYVVCLCLMSHVSCLISHVSCLMSHVSFLTSHVSCLQHPFDCS